MWFIPVLVIGAIVVAAASKSSRESAPPSRQLPPAVMSGPSMLPGSGPKLPGPISVLGEILRIGKYPPPRVILCAIAEAQALGRQDLVADITNAFIVPVVQQYQYMCAHNVCAPPDAWMPQATYGREACAPRASCSPRARADAYDRGSCSSRRSAREQADLAWMPQATLPYPTRSQVDQVWMSRAQPVPVSCAPRASAAPSPAAAQAQAIEPIAIRQPTEDEILGMLHSDPKAFLSMVTGQQQRRGPLVEVFPLGTSPMTATVEPAPSPQMQQPPSSTPNADAFAEQLLSVPGHAGSGILRVDPTSGAEVFEVRWLRGYPIPPLPEVIDGRPVRVVIVDSLPQPQPAGLHPEVVAQMQEQAGLPEAADQTRALAPGSPIPGVADDSWRTFVTYLAREAPTYSSGRSIGQYRQRRERLADLGIDPRSIIGSVVAQRAALDADLADAYNHAVRSGLVAEHVGRSIVVPGREGAEAITLSGLLGVIQCAGLDGAVGWLERPGDRKRYPHTSQVHLRTNGVF